MQADLKNQAVDPLARAGDPEELYQLAIRHRVLYPSRAIEELAWSDSRMARAVYLLVESGLLQALADDSSALVPVAPQVAASRRLDRLHTQIARMEQESDLIRAELSVFQELHERGSLDTRTTLHRITGVEAIAAEITVASRECRDEAILARPGGDLRAPEALRLAWTPEELTMDQRVRVRALYQHAARFDQRTRENVAQLLAGGGEVRTLADPFDQILVFDRTTAIIAADDDRESAVVIRQPDVVDFLLRAFERAWVTGHPFENRYRAAEVSELISGVRMSIAQLLADGETDEAIARRLGVSVRTCRGHVAKIYQELGARSRCQLGVLLAQSGLLDQDPPARRFAGSLDPTDQYRRRSVGQP